MERDGRGIGFKRHLRPEVVPGDGTYLLCDAGATALSGDDVALLAPLLDGTRGVDTIVDELAGQLSAVRIGQLLGQLMSAGFVRFHDLDDRDDRDDPDCEPVLAGAAATAQTTRWADSPGVDTRLAEQAYWDSAGLDASRVPDRFARAGVEIVCVGSATPDAVVAALATAGVVPRVRRNPLMPVDRRTDGPALRDLTLVLTDDYLHPDLARLDRLLAAAGRPWLLARVDGPATWIGPIFGVADPCAEASDPGGSPDPACWECLAHRLRGNRAWEGRVCTGSTDDWAAGHRRIPAACTPLSVAAGAHQVALAASHYVAGLVPRDAAIAVHDPVAGTLVQHPVRRRPECGVCGDPGLTAARAARPISITSRPSSFAGTTGHRTVRSTQMLERFGHLVGPITGVVPEVRRDDRAPDGMHVYLSGVNPAARAVSRADLRRGLRQACGGKGTTPVDAQAGALCEALERYCGQLHGDELRRTARLRELTDALDPRDSMLFDPRQYAVPPSADTTVFEHVPTEFDPDALVDWTPVWSLTRQRHVQVPTAMLYYDLSGGAVRGGEYCVADSNGNAAGSSIEDAILQGFLELVERDAVAIWWYNRLRQPAFDLDAFSEPWLDEQRVTHAAMGRELTVLDVTSDLGVPVAAAVSRRTDPPGSEDICVGFGAHLDPAIAVRRAIAEVAQILPAALPGNGDYASDDPQLIDWWRRANIDEQSYLVADPDVPAHTQADFDYRPRFDLADEVADIVSLTEAHGLELLVLDQTRADIGLPVVKVIVPGLRHFWRRLAPGRLFDVPVALGRLDAPTPYDELNPIAVFL